VASNGVARNIFGVKIGVSTVYIAHGDMSDGMDHHGEDQNSWIVSSRRGCMRTIEKTILHRLLTKLSYYSTELTVERTVGGILQT
jgi:hypothetical protein